MTLALREALDLQQLKQQQLKRVLQGMRCTRSMRLSLKECVTQSLGPQSKSTEQLRSCCSCLKLVFDAISCEFVSYLDPCCVLQC
jgi:hypothetical protein